MNQNLLKFGNKKPREKTYDVFVKEKSHRSFVVYVKNANTKEVEYDKCKDAVSEKQANFIRDTIAKDLSKKGHQVRNDKTIYQ